MISTLPNIISLSRIILAPIFYILLAERTGWTSYFAAFVFVVGALTDYFDGWFARKRNQTSNFGMFFDPLADKVLTAAAFLAFVSMGVLPLWMTLVVVVRDVFQTLFRLFADSIHQNIATSKTAKIKTMLQMIFIIVLLFFDLCSHLLSDASSRLYFLGLLYSDAVYYFMLSLTLFTLYTSVEYVIVNRHVFRRFFSIDGSVWSKIMSSTLIGIGFIPVMPGTAASAIVLLFALFPFGSVEFLLLSAAFCGVGFWSISATETMYGSDAPEIVIDEAMGMCLALAAPIPHSPVWTLVTFLLFRFFDIRKPFPIRWLNAKRGVFWVMADDAAAGIAAGVCAYILFWGTTLLVIYGFFM